jgi:hypothetical protein
LPAACAGFFDAISATLGGSFGVRDGGKITAKPGICGDDDVVTGAVLVAVVEAETGTVIGRRKTPSELLTEFGGVVVCDELSSEGREDRMDAERRRSLSGLVEGGGMLMLALSIVVFVSVDCS